MTAGRFLVLVIVVSAVVAGVAIWWLQTRAYYVRLESPEMTFVNDANGLPESVDVGGYSGIDANSSPIRYRACFIVDPELAEGAAPADNPVPLTAPGWFDCFDAGAIGAALDRGEARAIASRRNVPWGIDRVVALFPDGRGYAWTQINHCGKAAFDGRAVPADCPPRPEDK